MAAERLACELPSATRAAIAGCAHLAQLDRPAELNALVLGFLDDVLIG